MERFRIAMISIQAQHWDGFSSELLQWSLDVRDGLARAEAEWFEYGAPGHKGRRTATFAFPLEWIVPLFDSFAALEADYDHPITDSQTQRLTVQVDERQQTCRVYAEDMVLTEHPEVEAFYRLWNPVERAVLRALDLPFRRPKE
jgi:hypothetical protein